jgi:hypothetical protein
MVGDNEGVRHRVGHDRVSPLRSLIWRFAVIATPSAGSIVAAMPANAAESQARADPVTQLTVVMVTLAAFAGAAVAARTARRNPRSGTPVFDDSRLDAPLLDVSAVDVREPPVVSSFERVFLIVLAAYALFDRAFAWIHVPGTPLFVGEITLAFGVLAMMATRAPIARAFRSSAAMRALGAWMVWGVVFMILQLPGYGLDTIRDSAIWYYGAVAILVVFLLVSDPSRFGRWSDAYMRFMPILLVWSLVAMVMVIVFSGGPPYVPDSRVSIFAHRFGNIAVQAAMVLGFIWLVDRARGRLTATQRNVYTGLAIVAILVVGFQNRGGMVAATVGIALMIAFMQKWRGELILSIGALVIVLATFAIVSDVSINLSGGRNISAAQMMDNIGSIIDPSSGGSRQQTTTQWRLDLWTAVLDDVITEHPVAGFGPGPDLGARYGVSTNEETPLRNPHNSHLSVVARMGLVGFALWGVLWISWAFQLMLLRSRLLQRGRAVEAGLTAWLIISAIMILTNAIFDPTLEGPQVSFWLWTVFGVGLAMPLVYTGIAGARWAGSALKPAAQLESATPKPST